MGHQLAGAHGSWCPDWSLGSRTGGWVEELGEAEVSELAVSGRAQQHVLRLQIPQCVSDLAIADTNCGQWPLMPFHPFMSMTAKRVWVRRRAGGRGGLDASDGVADPVSEGEGREYLGHVEPQVIG